MLTQIQLRNFQIHRSRVLNLEPGLNIFTGPSDTGKSAIVRALKFLILHESASGLLTNGETDLSVSLTTEDEDCVTRFKSTKEYGYTVNDKKYLACARDQPLAVTTALEITATNIQSQHDPHFLLSMTPGQIAKEINKIVALEDIDKALGWLKEQIRATGILHKAEQAKVEELDLAIQAMNYVPLMGDIVKQMQAAVDAMELVAKQANDLAKLRDDLITLKSNYSSLKAKEALTSSMVDIALSYGVAKSTKQALATLVQDLQVNNALPTLEALGAILEGRVLVAKEVVRLTGDISGVLEAGRIISVKKSEMARLLSTSSATMVSTSKQLRQLADNLEGIQNEELRHKTREQELEQLIAKRAVCEKCGRKY